MVHAKSVKEESQAECRRQTWKRGAQKQKGEPSSQVSRRSGHRPQAKHIKDTTQAYAQEILCQVGKLIAKWEEALTHQAEEEHAVLEGELIVPDQGNTRGTPLKQYQKTLHLYWRLKHLVEKSIMHTTNFMQVDPSLQEIQKDFQLVQFQVQQQNSRLGRIEQLLKRSQQSEMLESSARDLAPIESSED